MTWWNSTYAVPGIDGDAMAPMIASVASVDLELLALEPAVEDRRRRAGEDLDRLLPVGAELDEGEPELGELPQVRRAGTTTGSAAS